MLLLGWNGNLAPVAKPIIAPAAWPFPTPIREMGSKGPSITYPDDDFSDLSEEEQDALLAPNDPARSSKQEEVYVIETICDDCGAPLGVRAVSAGEFEKASGRSHAMIQEHNSWEHDYDESRILGVKMNYSQCSSCRCCC
jgi:hypothetical protein